MRPLFLLSVLVIAAATGLGATLYVVSGTWRPGRVVVAGWVTWPVMSTKDQDPYTAAIIATNGEMPLGPGEGLVLVRTRDDGGRPFNGACIYAIKGFMPPARLWTLTVTSRDGMVIPNPSGRYALTSEDVLRDKQGKITIRVGSEPAPGDWLPAQAGEPFNLIIRIYDTPISNATGALTPAIVPEVVRERCP